MTTPTHPADQGAPFKLPLAFDSSIYEIVDAKQRTVCEIFDHNQAHYLVRSANEAGERTWQPIETAPKTIPPTRILVFAEREGYEPITIAAYVMDGRGEDGFWAMPGPRTIPTKWMQLPSPPTTNTNEH